MRRSPLPLRRWKFEGIANFRDLGGYPCDGGMTRYGVFFRSTHFHRATPDDLLLLRKTGISTVLDLRYPSEVSSFPDRVPPGVEVINRSLMGDITAEMIDVHSTVADTRTMKNMYCQIFESCRPGLVEALRVLVHAKGGVAFHCASGKDRTGMISMLLLGLAGVSREDIVADYEVSRTYIRSFTDDISGSHYSNMEQALDRLERDYGGVVRFLDSIGLENTEMTALKERFIEN